MKTFEIQRYQFDRNTLDSLATSREINWLVVYQIYNNDELYVGETTGLKMRMCQHYENPEKLSLRTGNISVIYDSTFNKSVALDLESFLIQYFSGDGKYSVMNRNDGMCDRDYYNREDYRKKFEDIWEELRRLHIADKSIQEIRNSELFKFSPYKSLNENQMNVVMEILQDIDNAFREGKKSLSIINGDAGTGKTIVIMYLAKLLADLQTFKNLEEGVNEDSVFKEFFENEVFNRRLGIGASLS